MEETIAEKDAGVTIDNKLSFDKHITEKVNKANSIIGVIRRTLEYLDLKTFRMLYVSLVRTRHTLDAYLSVSLRSH
jgi:hypothetical protein